MTETPLNNEITMNVIQDISNIFKNKKLSNEQIIYVINILLDIYQCIENLYE